MALVQRDELFTLVDRRLGALQTQIAQARADVLAADGRTRSKGEFKFAGEGDDEPVDLPNPLRRTIN